VINLEQAVPPILLREERSSSLNKNRHRKAYIEVEARYIMVEENFV